MMHTRKNKSNKLPAISTASLPDIVFILLFFFMTVTTIKNQNLLVENKLPLASETEELNKTDRIIEIFIGQSELIKDAAGNSTVQVQIEDRLVDVQEVGHQATIALQNIPEHLRKMAVVSIKADNKVKMGLVNDVKKQLRAVNLLKVNYTTVKGDVFQNL